MMYMMSYGQNDRQGVHDHMSTRTVTVAQARSDFPNLLAHAELLDRRFIIARRGKPKAALVSVKDLARLESLEQADASSVLDRDQTIRVLKQAGLLRPVSADLVDHHVCLEPDQREAVRQGLANRNFDPPLNEQIIADRGEE
jgi:prevent-host-death family protein